jgi:hypothetical protein
MEFEGAGMRALQFSLEDFIFGFTVAGACVGYFDSLLQRNWGYSKAHPGWTRDEHARLRRLVNWDMGRLLMGVGLVLGPIAWLFVCGVNSVWGHVVVCSLVTLLLMVGRPDWWPAVWRSAIFGGVLMAVFYLFYYQPLKPDIIVEWWLLDNLCGLQLPNLGHARIYPGAPIEEVLWGMATAPCVGALARFCTEHGEDKRWPAPPVPAQQLRERRTAIRSARATSRKGTPPPSA